MHIIFLDPELEISHTPCILVYSIMRYFKNASHNISLTLPINHDHNYETLSILYSTLKPRVAVKSLLRWVKYPWHTYNLSVDNSNIKLEHLDPKAETETKLVI